MGAGPEEGVDMLGLFGRWMFGFGGKDVEMGDQSDDTEMTGVYGQDCLRMRDRG